MATFPALREEIDHWFFSQYFKDFIAIGAGKLDPDRILAYWGAPIHMSGPAYARWVTSAEEVVHFLQEMQGVLTQAGYTHTEVVDSKITIYGENASRVETIMSRCRTDGTEMDRAAISFEVRRTEDSWTIISTTATPTKLSKLHDIW
jgi:NTF2-like protein (DUF6841)